MSLNLKMRQQMHRLYLKMRRVVLVGDSTSMKVVRRGRTIFILELFFDMDLQVTFQSKRELIQRTET